SHFFPVNCTFSALMTMMKSPVSQCGADCGLCLPRRRLASSTARRPTTRLVASITYQFCSAVALLAMKVDIGGPILIRARFRRGARPLGRVLIVGRAGTASRGVSVSIVGNANEAQPGPSRAFGARQSERLRPYRNRLTILPGKLRFMRLDSLRGAFIMQATHPKARMQANHSEGRFLAACGLDWFRAEVVAEPPVASELKVKWWPRGRAAARRNEPRKANCSRHLRRMRDCLEKRKAASKYYCGERSRISAVGFGHLRPGNRCEIGVVDRVRGPRWSGLVVQRAPTSGRIKIDTLSSCLPVK